MGEMASLPRGPRIRRIPLDEAVDRWFQDHVRLQEESLPHRLKAASWPSHEPCPRVCHFCPAMGGDVMPWCAGTIASAVGHESLDGCCCLPTP